MKTILLVEDDPFTVDIYSSQLKKGNYKVDTANNVKMALDKIRNNYPDLLILDLNLDNRFQGPKDGLDILKIIRQDPKTKNLKVIVITNYNEKNFPELSELSSLGVIKSFLKIATDTDEVMSSVKEILK